MSRPDFIIPKRPTAQVIVGDALVGRPGPQGAPGVGGSELAGQLAQEIADREAGDALLNARADQITDDLAQEVAARLSGDQSLATALVAETAARQAADSDLDGRIAPLEATVPTLATAAALTAEITARQAGDATLAGDLAAEVTARQAGDAALDTRVSAVETALPGLATDQELTDALAAEAASRTQAVASLNTAILGEGAAWRAAVATETSARQTGDSALATSLAGETTARQAADAALDTRLTAAEGSLLDAVRDDDPRLSNARTPTPHTHAVGDVTGLIDALADRPTQDEADLRYRQNATAVPWSELSDVPTAFPPEHHQHAIMDVTGLEAALNERPTGAQTDALYRSKFDFVPWDEIANAPDFAPAIHGHVIGDVSGLQAALDDKAPATHTHTAAQISDATATGRAVLTAADAAAARTAIGAAEAGASGLPSGGSDGDMLRKSTGAAAIWETISTLAGRVVDALAGSLVLVNPAGQGLIRLASSGANACRIFLSSISPATRALGIRTGDGTASSQDRWLAFQGDSTAESGSNAGTNLRIGVRYSDTGVLLGTIWELIRATGQAIYNGLEIFVQTGDLRLAAGNIIATVGRIDLNSNAAEIRFSGMASFSNSLDLRYGTGNQGARIFPHGVRSRSTNQGDHWFYDDGPLTTFTTSAAASVTANVMGSIWLVLSGSGGSTSIAINNPTNAPLNGNANSGRFTVTVENRGSGNAATPTFGNQWDARAWGAALAPNTFRRADFVYLATNVGTKRYFQITDWQTFTP